MDDNKNNYPHTQKTNVLQKVTDSLIRQVRTIVEETDANAIFVYSDALETTRIELPATDNCKVFYITRTAGEHQQQLDQCRNCIRVPNVPLPRIGQIKIAVLIALSQGLLKKGDIIVFLAGIAATGTLDTLMVMQVGNEFEMFFSPDEEGLASDYKPEVLSRVIDIASELGSEGREGKPVGALFVLGDSEKTLSYSRQLILNPFQGYPPEQRNILDLDLEETIKEFSSFDGAFIINSEGVIVTAGAHLIPSSPAGSNLPQGLGARHQAAAAITSVTQSVAVAVSESTGTVTIFKGGKIVTEIEKLRSLGK